MFPLKKLKELEPGQRRRKLILMLTEFERILRARTSRLFLGGGISSASISADGTFTDGDLLSLYRFVIEDPKLHGEDLSVCAGLAKLLEENHQSASGNHGEGPVVQLRLCNLMRNILMRAAGTFPAEWDLIHPESSNRGDFHDSAIPDSTPRQRPFYPGVFAFAEDIRSPFNVGSIFRTAEAFGAEKLFLSPGCAPAEHPRARRSAMGCVDYMEWEKIPMRDLPAGLPVFALETGGTPIEEFSFPEKGIVVIGSEELGVSPEALDMAESRVSIPMKGIKASLNVGVAFGILMEAWTRSLRKQ